MSEPRYTKPGKLDAYRTATKLAAELTDDELLESGWRPYNHIKTQIIENHPALAVADVADVSAKVLRVERGKRRGNIDYRQENVRLSLSDRQMLDELEIEHRIPRAAVFRNAIRLYHRQTFGK